MLAIYPEMQDKCYEEIRSVLPNKEDELSYDDLSKLDYVERCLKETMRLFPTVPVVARKVDINFNLNGRWHLRADPTRAIQTTIAWPGMGMHSWHSTAVQLII